MKALIASLVTAVLLCVVVLVRSGFAQANFTCAGPYPGCTFQQCTLTDGVCPPGGDNPGVPFMHATYTPVSVFSCVPVGINCPPETVVRTYCSVTAYAALDVHGDCSDATCFFDETVKQCM